jgi:hypothetical protein
MNALKRIRASAVEPGVLQQKYKNACICRDSGIVAGSTCSPSTKPATHMHVAFPWLFHQLILEYKQTARDFLTLKGSLKHERHKQSKTKKYGPWGNSHSRSRK